MVLRSVPILLLLPLPKGRVCSPQCTHIAADSTASSHSCQLALPVGQKLIKPRIHSAVTETKAAPFTRLQSSQGVHWRLDIETPHSPQAGLGGGHRKAF